MLNRRTFLGAAVAATILPAGEALAAKPASGHVLSDRKIEAHETPEGVLYTVEGNGRWTSALESAWTPRRYIVISALWDSPLTPETIAAYERSARYLPHRERGQPVVNSFSRPPSLEDVVAFHDACCADVPGRMIDAREEPSGVVFYGVMDQRRETARAGANALTLHSVVTWRKATPLSEVLAFHERCCAEDGAAAPRD